MQQQEDRKKALEKKFVENRPPLAYAKLSGKILDDTDFEILLTHLPAELGRGQVSISPGPRISLGDHKAISRQHARIQWNPQKSCFELECLGKNGMFAAGKFIPKDKTIELVSKMPLKIGHARVYFLAAIRSACSTMSGFKLLQKGFEKAKSTTGMTAEEACQQILDLFPKSEVEVGGRENLRTFVTSYLEEDAQNFDKVPGTNPPRYKMKPAVVTSNTTASIGKTNEGEAPKKKQKVGEEK